jgi:uncharacterized membrane protein YczE
LIVLPPRDRRRQRFARLLAGLALYGFSDGLLLLAGLGVDPWDVLHQGLSRRLGLGVGTWVSIVGAVVLLAWIPLRQRPGVGTVLNVLTIGAVMNLVLAELPPARGLPAQLAVLAVAIVLNGIATGLYIGAGLGPGPRDGLMTGLASRGHSVRVVRTCIELSVLTGGWLLGGSVGIGTVAYAVLIGPIVHLVLPRLRLGPEQRQDCGQPPGQVGVGVGEGAGPLALDVEGADHLASGPHRRDQL